MVILGLEKPVEYGSRQIFDPTMAQMVLRAQNNYVNAMREDYLQGREDLKEFNKNFGDFFSPIQKDMEWYDQNVTGATRDLINNLYAQGIDPLRSAEGRAAISRWVNSMPVGKINQLKQSATAANEYLKNKGALEAAGKFNQDFEDFINGGMSLSNWDTARNGMWTRTAPAEIKSLKELTESSYNNRTPHDLTKDEVLSFQGQTYDPRMRYKGFTDADLLNIANTIAPGLTGTPWFDYYRDLAKRQVAASGKELTTDNINAQLARNIANSQQEYLIKPIGDLSDWYQQQNLSINRQKLQLAKDKAAAAKKEKDKITGWTYRQQLKVALQKSRSGGIRETFDTWSKSHKGGRGLSSGEKSLISQYYKSTQEIPTAGDQTTAKAFFAGLEKAEKQGLSNPDLSRVTMEFNDNTLNLTKIRQYAHANKNMTKGSLSVRFNNFLKRNHISGFSTAGEVSVNWTPVGDTDFYELNGTVSVKRKDLDNFFLNVNGKGNSVTDEEKLVRMANLGLTLRDRNGKIINPDGTKANDIRYGEIQYVDIPTTRTISAEGEDNRMIDKMDNIINVGKSVAAKREPTYTYDYDEEE